MFKAKFNVIAATALAAVLGTTALMPVTASAQTRWQQSQNQQTNKNNWRNLAIGAAGIAAAGLLSHNNTVAVLGAAGAAYSANRYEQDRHSQSQQQNDWRYNRGGYYRGGRGYNGSYGNYGDYSRRDRRY